MLTVWFSVLVIAACAGFVRAKAEETSESVSQPPETVDSLSPLNDQTVYICDGPPTIKSLFTRQPTLHSEESQLWEDTQNEIDSEDSPAWGEGRWRDKRQADELREDVHYLLDHTDTKRAKPSFNSWGGKRTSSFHSWGGKRTSSFHSWGGKRSEDTSISTDLLAEADKRSDPFIYLKFADALASNNGGFKRRPAFNSWGGKRSPPAFSSWGGKRDPTFNSWSGKRGPAFNSWGGKRGAQFNSWGGKRGTSEAFNSWSGKRGPAFNSWGGKRGTSEAFNSWSGKRGPAFNSWGGKRSVAFNSWGGKREAPAFNSWGGKRGPSFYSWGGKRSVALVNKDELITDYTEGSSKNVKQESRRDSNMEPNTLQKTDPRNEGHYLRKREISDVSKERVDNAASDLERILPSLQDPELRKLVHDFSERAKKCLELKSQLHADRIRYLLNYILKLTEREPEEKKKSIVHQMLLRASVPGYQGSTFSHARRGAEFHSWGGKRSSLEYD